MPEPGAGEPRTIPGTSLTYTEGSLVRYLRNGHPEVAAVTEIWTHFDPVRWEGVREEGEPVLIKDGEGEWVEVDQNNNIWAYESDIIAVCQY